MAASAVLAALLLGGTLALHVALAQDAADPLTREERQWLAEHGPLRVAFSPTGPPFELETPDGRLTGINADVLALITVKTGIEFVATRPASFPAMYAGIENGTYDLFAIAVRTPDREETLDWTRPYAWARTGFWVTDRTPDIASLDDLGGQRVVIVNNAVHGKYLNETFPALEQVRVRTAKDAVDALASGEVDVMYAGHANTGFYVRSLDLQGFRTLGEPNVNEVHFATREGNARALAIMDKALAQLDREELLGIYVKWTGQDLGPPAAAAGGGLVLTPLHRALIAAGGGLILVLGGGTLLLQRQVASRTRDLRELNATLEQRVAERTRELAERTEDLHVLNSAVSHDLRTRLTAADGFTRILAATEASRLTPEGQDRLGRLETTHRRMGVLMEDVLRLSRATRAPLELEDVDVTALARDVVAMLREAEPERAVETIVPDGLVARADPALLRIALENLLGNAWKFTAARADARIEVGVARSPRGRALFVRDNGAGFDPARADRLFQPFERLHAAHEYAGTGLGLATVRRAVERHGGAVWAESSVDGGATFWFTLGGERE